MISISNWDPMRHGPGTPRNLSSRGRRRDAGTSRAGGRGRPRTQPRDLAHARLAAEPRSRGRRLAMGDRAAPPLGPRAGAAALAHAPPPPPLGDRAGAAAGTSYGRRTVARRRLWDLARPPSILLGATLGPSDPTCALHRQDALRLPHTPSRSSSWRPSASPPLCASRACSLLHGRGWFHPLACWPQVRLLDPLACWLAGRRCVCSPTTCSPMILVTCEISCREDHENRENDRRKEG